MALTIKDGAGSITNLKTTLTGSEHMPHHVVQAVSGTVAVSASAANPVYVTGNVSITQPVNVDVNLSDQLTVVVSSSQNNNAVWITSSANYPAAVTGTVYVGNSVLQISADSYMYPGAAYGALITKITQSVDEGIHVTSSKNLPLFVVSDSDKPVVVASSPGIPVYVTSSGGSPVFVSASDFSPVPITSSDYRPVFVTNNELKPVFVTSSNSYPVVTKNAAVNSTSRTSFTSYASTINWAGTGSSDISGTFILANSSSTRRGLMFANNTSKDLYIALGDNDLASTNGFLLTTTASAPAVYSFILYPSGTYFAEPSFVNVKHSGFFISSSNIDVSVTVVGTE
jgi:hypothetical protein